MPRGGKRKGAGRPKLDPRDKLSAILAIPCTPADKARWERVAKKKGKKLPVWARARLG